VEPAAGAGAWSTPTAPLHPLRHGLRKGILDAAEPTLLAAADVYGADILYPMERDFRLHDSNLFPF
jgi:hypothetical protein